MDNRQSSVPEKTHFPIYSLISEDGLNVTLVHGQYEFSGQLEKDTVNPTGENPHYYRILPVVH
ncbi:hypothetical protein SAMN02745220_00499 [Desulfopila aestuarii DSM 18488]|uniref:Uncharacterized protein n=1 Tax=Desulfopila aestuarii DSM 18488 TaxID=1121416 RepID=A0A1M7XXU9_9BACT|nr:hypothetical protein SAMN02745220_00499 [Desulfopila aestuarii DSM 18488]